MLSIDEAIQKENETAEEKQKIVDTGILCDDISLSQLYCDDTEVIEEHLSNYRKCIEYHKQLSEWLEELKGYQEISKKNPFLVDMIKHDKIVRNKAIDDFVNACKEDILCQTFGLHIKGIEGIAEQLKAGGENDL